MKTFAHMNLTMSVEMTLVLFLLCSGFSHFTFASNRLRVLRFPGTDRTTWHNVPRECNETGESYMTLYDEEDYNIISSLVNPHPVWVGLHKSRNVTWSNGEPVTFKNISLDVSNDTQLCVAVDTKWEGFNCSERKHFMCKNGRDYTLIESPKNWCQALQFCRNTYGDLASINNDTQNENAIKAGKNTSFWIGLMLDEWEWEDGSCSSFREWNQNPSEPEEIYTKSTTSGIALAKVTKYSEECSLCSKGNRRIVVIDKNVTWEQAFQYCQDNHTGLLWINDQVDQTAVEQWLNHTNVTGPFWIGLRQSRVFGFWIWPDSIVRFKNFKREPGPELPLYDTCGAINEMDGQWSDEKCLDQKPFLCEEEIVFMNKSKTVRASSGVSHP